MALFLVLAISLFNWVATRQTLSYQVAAPDSDNLIEVKPEEPPAFRVTHLDPPAAVKAIYMTSWVAGTLTRRNELIKLIKETEINAVVIDIKDYSGRIAFAVADPEIMASGAVEERIKNIKEFIGELHEAGIYVIGRISVFQDSFFTSRHPEFAVHRLSDGGVWKDRKGISWLEVGATPVWDYIIKISKESYAVGFDELNFDYIRFPSDGNMSDIAYRFVDLKTETRSAALAKFFKYLDGGLADLNVRTSADLFGLTTTSLDDLGIGQVLVEAAPYFDYIAPMVYPSHFASGFLNFKNPATEPHAVVKHSMSTARDRLLALNTATSTTATSTPPLPAKKIATLRPWLQDFDLGTTYTAEMVRAQIQATYDSGLTSWMLWDPANHYTSGALLLE